MIELINANSQRIPLADKSVHMIVTSPPYWSLRDYGVGGQLGLEPLHDCQGWATGDNCGECFICNLRAWAAECWRVLRDDGTLWLNLGDSYTSGMFVHGYKRNVIQPQNNWADTALESRKTTLGATVVDRDAGTLKPKDLCMIPARAALALQADGWYLRDDIPWVKAWMKTDDVPMWDMPVGEVLEGSAMPGSQSDRPTSSWEHIFLLTKSRRYFFDADAIRAQSGAIFRNVWRINPKNYKGAHFATFAPELPKYAILFGTSEAGVCPHCKAQWARVVERTGYHFPEQDKSSKQLAAGVRISEKKSGPDYARFKAEHPDMFLGFRPTCDCPPHEPIPATVLDPFAGSGTTLMVARQLGRSAVGLDLSLPYLRDQARKRLSLDALEAWTNGVARDGGGSGENDGHKNMQTPIPNNHPHTMHANRVRGVQDLEGLPMFEVNT